ncbi:MAG: LLM class flavin-dependent oxidoreductase [Eubacteriales bacterium]|nr:LLM class flavin-dependent oxidoreductase [Eubacteriales bacterium]
MNMYGSKAEKWRNEIKAYIVRAGMTMNELVEVLAKDYGWSRSVPNFSGKLKRGSLRYIEAVELADVLGYDLVWSKRCKA